MGGTVSWMLTLSVNDRKLDEFRALMDEMVTATREEPGTLMYEWFLSDDGACHLYERYTDDAATMVHLGNFGSKFAGRFLGCVTPTGFSVYGNPGAEVRQGLSALGPVYLAPFGGFAR